MFCFLTWINNWQLICEGGHASGVALLPDMKIRQVLISDLVIRFSNISMEQVVVNYPTDEERRRALQHQGYKVGSGSGQAWNCLSDSLLQLLLHASMIRQP